MSFFNSLFINIFNKQVGKDCYDNKFYESRATDYLGKKRRYVVYNGFIEPSKVPPMWHAWLHHLSDELPNKNNNFAWQQQHKPNLTGTNFAFNPSKTELSNDLKINNYNKWQPK